MTSKLRDRVSLSSILVHSGENIVDEIGSDGDREDGGELDVLFDFSSSVSTLNSNQGSSKHDYKRFDSKIS